MNISTIIASPGTVGTLKKKQKKRFVRPRRRHTFHNGHTCSVIISQPYKCNEICPTASTRIRGPE